MKKFVLLMLVFGFGVSLMAQQRPFLQKEKRDIAFLKPKVAIKDVGNTNPK